MNKGIYCLLIYLNESKTIKIGKIGSIYFKKGYYCYVGSALNNLEKRIARHKRKNKKIRWHIDYLLKHAKIINVFSKSTTKKIECKINKRIEKKSDRIINKFGSSDCLCKAHLHYCNRLPKISNVL